MKTLSKVFYSLHMYGLSRKCDPVTYMGLRLNDISEKLETMADAFARLGEAAKTWGGNGEINEEDTTTQEEQ